MRRAQVSVEYLLIMAFAFFLTIPLVTLFYSQSNELDEEVTGAQVDRIASEIADAVNEVYYYGPPSKKTITVYMPEDVQQVTLSGNTIVFRVNSRAGQYDVVKVTATNLSGNIDTFTGIHNIEVVAQLSQVQING